MLDREIRLDCVYPPHRKCLENCPLGTLEGRSAASAKVGAIIRQYSPEEKAALNNLEFETYQQELLASGSTYYSLCTRPKS